uniref:Opsin 9 n=1 Tax=Seriola dumerili TaxID=41447 RepID=A0A3B4UE57_SERDU
MEGNGSHRGSWFEPSSIQPLFLSQLSPSADLAVAIFLTFTVTSVLGNGTVLLVYCRKKKKLRPPELMTINLALCDFGFSLLGAPFFITSLCHAWVFGETGCLLYGIQGFVFGIGSLLTTCLISLDRCLKICCLRYQWIERRHASLSIALVWVYTLFWASLPALGFGSYGPEPYGTSCTIDWRMRVSPKDRLYIFLILALCLGFPMLTIFTSYLAILLTVYRSNRTLASIPSSSVSHTSKDLRLAKMAAVVCSTFLLAWMPYATVSLISALIPRDDQEAESTVQTAVEESTAMASNSPKILDVPSLLNWTATEYYRLTHYNPEELWDHVADVNPNSGLNGSTSSSTLGEEAESMTRVPQPRSCLPPVVTLIPAMFAKSHCMINPLIYQIMNREFRDDVYVLVFGREKAERRRSIIISYCQGWRRKRSNSMSVGRRNKSVKSQGSSSGGRSGSCVDDRSVGADLLDFASLDTWKKT